MLPYFLLVKIDLIPAGAILYPLPCGKHLILQGFSNSCTREGAFLEGFRCMPVTGWAGHAYQRGNRRIKFGLQISDCRLENHAKSIPFENAVFSLQSAICYRSGPSIVECSKQDAIMLRGSPI